MAGGPGFEPELPGPEPGVLPLNYPPQRSFGSIIFSCIWEGEGKDKFPFFINVGSAILIYESFC